MKSKRIVAVRRRQQRGSSLLESTFCLTAFIFLTMVAEVRMVDEDQSNAYQRL